MQIEAYLDNETLTTCKNESGYQWNSSLPGVNVGYALASKLFYGMVTPFVNMTIAGGHMSYTAVATENRQTNVLTHNAWLCRLGMVSGIAKQL
eukprot:SAG31_NODE_2414_length_5736_cov_5.853823_3_plen_93_part_00